MTVYAAALRETPATPAAPVPATGHAWRDRDTLIAAGTTVVGLVLWIVGAAMTNPRNATGWGLASVLPWTVWTGLILTAGGLAWAIHHRLAREQLGVTLGVLIFQMFGLPPLVEGWARTSTAWVHLGFIDQYAVYGESARNIDARFSWPGFFSWWGMLTDAVGAHRLAQVANWWPLACAFLTAALVWRLARALDAPYRAAWYAAALVSVLNWIEQDYFSPQSTGFLLSLAVITLLLSEPQQRAARERIGSLILVSVFICAIVMTHQLTPFMLGSQLVMILIARRKVRAVRGVWTAIIVLAASLLTWFVLGAHEFWSGQALRLLTDNFGNVGESVGVNLTDRIVSVDPGIAAVRKLRIVYFLGTLMLGGLGLLVRLAATKVGWRIWKAGKSFWLPALLIAAPAPAVVQAYGGELFLRVALFSMPVCAVLGGELFDKLSSWKPNLKLFAVPIVALAGLACSLVLVRGGNDGFAYVSGDEVKIVDAAIAATPPHGILLFARDQGPERPERVITIQWASVGGVCGEDISLSDCAGMQSANTIVVTRSMVRWGQLGEGLPADWAQQEVTTLVADGTYTVLTQNRDGIVLVRKATTN
ncbi:hypothetical protein [Paractinoplanes durhamensis]|uniref:Glycosyltransferase n=1 Tax=Paractinoplanes durhamensis TaxID=113563 RepID=A0ABQ3YTM4_9ACTN|nr:hypothetical protein [Actinoplanes durhamensis]GIE00912.1 hypothetical protein Adu01nite_22620 [Actinoplanes durhamensis]